MSVSLRSLTRTPGERRAMVRLDRLSQGPAVVVARLCLRFSRVMHRSLRLCLMAMMMRPLSKSKRSPQGAGKPGKGLRSAKKQQSVTSPFIRIKKGGTAPE